MSGAIHHCPSTTSWRGAQLKHRETLPSLFPFLPAYLAEIGTAYFPTCWMQKQDGQHMRYMYEVSWCRLQQLDGLALCLL
jgi:hypothetical protein